MAQPIYQRLQPGSEAWPPDYRDPDQLDPSYAPALENGYQPYLDPGKPYDPAPPGQAISFGYRPRPGEKPEDPDHHPEREIPANMSPKSTKAFRIINTIVPWVYPAGYVCVLWGSVSGDLRQLDTTTQAYLMFFPIGWVWPVHVAMAFVIIFAIALYGWLYKYDISLFEEVEVRTAFFYPLGMLFCGTSAILFALQISSFATALVSGLGFLFLSAAVYRTRPQGTLLEQYWISPVNLDHVPWTSRIIVQGGIGWIWGWELCMFLAYLYLAIYPLFTVTPGPTPPALSSDGTITTYVFLGFMLFFNAFTTMFTRNFFSALAGALFMTGATLRLELVMSLAVHSVWVMYLTFLSVAGFLGLWELLTVCLDLTVWNN